MTASLTDRYVTATVRGLDDDQRAEVERELRTTIEDMIDGRLEAGAASRAEAERAVLAELGDPVRLAAGYSGRPLYLIGPSVYPQWRRTLDPAAVDARPAGDRDQPRRAALRRRRRDRRASARRSSGRCAVGFMVAVNVVFWVTVVFALAERGKVARTSSSSGTPTSCPTTTAPAGSGSARPWRRSGSSSSPASRSSGSRPARR